MTGTTPGLRNHAQTESGAWIIQAVWVSDRPPSSKDYYVQPFWAQLKGPENSLTSYILPHIHTHLCVWGRRTVLLNCSSQRYRVQYFCICTSRRFSQNCSDWIVFSCSAAVDVCVSPDWTEGEEGKMRKSRSVLTVSPNNVSHPAPLIFTHKKITTSCLLARVFKQKRCYITRELDPGEAPTWAKP